MIWAAQEVRQSDASNWQLEGVQDNTNMEKSRTTTVAGCECLHMRAAADGSKARAVMIVAMHVVGEER